MKSDKSQNEKIDCLNAKKTYDMPDIDCTYSEYYFTVQKESDIRDQSVHRIINIDLCPYMYAAIISN